MKHQTIFSFVDSVRSKTDNEIYEEFEFNTEPAIRDAIMGMSPPTDPEPVRTGLNLLGRAYNVQGLIGY